jgi:hypothetical protein
MRGRGVEPESKRPWFCSCWWATRHFTTKNRDAVLTLVGVTSHSTWSGTVFIVACVEGDVTAPGKSELS